MDQPLYIFRKLTQNLRQDFLLYIFEKLIQNLEKNDGVTLLHFWKTNSKFGKKDKPTSSHFGKIN